MSGQPEVVALNRDEARDLGESLMDAAWGEVRFMVDNGALKVKLPLGGWSPPLGRVVS